MLHHCKHLLSFKNIIYCVDDWVFVSKRKLMHPFQVMLSPRIPCMCYRRLIRSCPPKLRRELTICPTMTLSLRVECTNTMHLKDKTLYVSLPIAKVLIVCKTFRHYLVVVVQWGGTLAETESVDLQRTS